MKKIGISSRIVENFTYKESRDALSHEWGEFLEKIDLIPIQIPNSLKSLDSFLKNIKLDGIILSGGDNIGEFPKRDKTEKELLEYGIQNKIPILGVCRGLQIINEFFGGRIIKSNSGKHVGKNHQILLENEFKKRFFERVEVNSFHNNIIAENQIGKNLQKFASDEEDKTVEGICHREFPIIGVMWHPERKQDNFNKNLVKTLFDEKKFW